MTASATMVTVRTGHPMVQAMTASASMSDVEIVALAREGDHQAFRILVERHQQRIYGLAVRILRDPDAARDASQEAFLKAYRSLRRFEGRSAFSTWMYRLTYNHCLDMKRRDRSNRHVEFEEERLDEARGVEPSGFGAAPETPGVSAERAELRGQIAEAIAELPEDARQTLLLREVDGLAYAEIAKMMGIPKGTVMSRLHHARRRVRALLEERGVRPAGGAPATPGDGEGGRS